MWIQPPWHQLPSHKSMSDVCWMELKWWSRYRSPALRRVLKTDLGVVYLASRILEFINPDLNIRGSLADIASDLRESMLGELDFREEQRNLDVYREFLSSNGLDPLAVAPQPFPEASAKRVLTMERLTGVPLTDLEAIKRYSNDPEQTLVNALNVWALSVQKCEFFHADVHAGNLLVLEDGRVGFIDFGIVGRLSPKMATGIDKLNEALAVSDARGMAQALISMGATVGKVDEDAFAADIQQLIAQLGGSLENATDATVDEFTDSGHCVGHCASGRKQWIEVASRIRATDQAVLVLWSIHQTLGAGTQHDVRRPHLQIWSSRGRGKWRRNLKADGFLRRNSARTEKIKKRAWWLSV